MPTFELTRAETPRRAHVEVDDTLTEAFRPFDLDPARVTEFYPWVLSTAFLPETWAIGLIVGASGSGKSTLLADFPPSLPIVWNPERAIVSHFADSEDAADRLSAVGLNSIPVWRQPFHTLSNGQQFRAELARRIGNGATVDEFTSVVDRNVAASASRALRAWVDRRNVQHMVLASCHRDVIPWLRPDWIADTDAGTLTVGEATEIPRWYGEWVKPEGTVGALELK